MADQEVDIRTDTLMKCPHGWMEGQMDRRTDQETTQEMDQGDLDQGQEGGPDQMTI